MVLYNWLMLSAIAEAKTYFREGYLSFVEPIDALRGWKLVLEADEADKHKLARGIFRFKTALFISFAGVLFPLGVLGDETHSLHVPIIGFGEDEDSTFLNDFFKDRRKRPHGSAAEFESRKADFHHVFFEGFHITIDIICARVDFIPQVV